MFLFKKKLFWRERKRSRIKNSFYLAVWLGGSILSTCIWTALKVHKISASRLLFHQTFLVLNFWTGHSTLYARKICINILSEKLLVEHWWNWLRVTISSIFYEQLCSDRFTLILPVHSIKVGYNFKLSILVKSGIVCRSNISWASQHSICPSKSYE